METPSEIEQFHQMAETLRGAERGVVIDRDTLLALDNEIAEMQKRLVAWGERWREAAGYNAVHMNEARDLAKVWYNRAMELEQKLDLLTRNCGAA